MSQKQYAKLVSIIDKGGTDRDRISEKLIFNAIIPANPARESLDFHRLRVRQGVTVNGKQAKFTPEANQSIRYLAGDPHWIMHDFDERAGFNELKNWSEWCCWLGAILQMVDEFEFALRFGKVAKLYFDVRREAKMQALELPQLLPRLEFPGFVWYHPMVCELREFTDEILSRTIMPGDSQTRREIAAFHESHKQKFADAQIADVFSLYLWNKGRPGQCAAHWTALGKGEWPTWWYKVTDKMPSFIKQVQDVKSKTKPPPELRLAQAKQELGPGLKDRAYFRAARVRDEVGFQILRTLKKPS